MSMGTSVNKPTNVAQRDADIDNKLRLYGIFQAFSNGKVPNNKQIDVAMNSLLASKAFSHPSGKLSEEGRHLVQDLKDIVEQVKMLLLTKNHDQVIQEFIWHTERATSTTSANTPNAPVSKDQANADGQKALNGLRTLGSLVISNGQFRKLLSDASVLFRDIASDTAQKAGGKIAPSEEQLQNIDKPEEDNVWHENPDLSKDNLKNRVKETYHKNKPTSRDEMREAMGDAAQHANPDNSRDPNAAANRAADDQRDGGNRGVDMAGGAAAGLESAKQKIADGIPQEHKDNVRDKKERTKGYLKDKMPEERRDQTIYRLKKMVVEIQGHQDYQDAIDTLLYLAETYGGHTKRVTQQTVGTVQEAHEDTHLQSAEKCFKTIMERFANNTSSQDLIDSINDIYTDADNDPELKKWFRQVDQYIRKCLKEQGYILKDEANDQYNALYDQGHFLLRERYRDHTDRIIDEFKFMGDQFAEDPQTSKLQNTFKHLFNDLGTDNNGKPAFKTHLVKDVTEVILPGFFENINYVPIPRIEYTDPQMDAIVENLVLEGDNLMPNLLEFGGDSYFKWGRKNISSNSRQSFLLSISGVQCDLKDVSYYVKKKQGFPSLTDTGVMDVFMGGEGFSFKIKMASADAKDRQNFFKVDKVDVSLKHINIRLKKSKHKTLFAIFKPLLLKVLRPVLQKVLEKIIKDTVTDLDRKLYAIKIEADKATEELKKNPDPENAQNIFSTYASAAQKELTAKKEKAEDAVADKKANVAITKEDSMFKNISLPGGVSTKATEYKDLARQGDRWQSPVFSIGSAKESSGIPTPAKITRKPHGQERAQVRGGNLDTNRSANQGSYSNSSTLPGQASQYTSSQQSDNLQPRSGQHSGLGRTGAGYEQTSNRQQEQGLGGLGQSSGLHQGQDQSYGQNSNSYQNPLSQEFGQTTNSQQGAFNQGLSGVGQTSDLNQDRLGQSGNFNQGGIAQNIAGLGHTASTQSSGLGHSGNFNQGGIAQDIAGLGHTGSTQSSGLGLGHTSQPFTHQQGQLGESEFGQTTSLAGYDKPSTTGLADGHQKLGSTNTAYDTGNIPDSSYNPGTESFTDDLRTQLHNRLG